VFFVVMDGLDSEEDALYKELWYACAGPLVTAPRRGDLVFYFPQGQIEQVLHKSLRILCNLFCSSPIHNLELQCVSFNPCIYIYIYRLRRRRIKWLSSRCRRMIFLRKSCVACSMFS
jgi:hypothetical protein